MPVLLLVLFLTVVPQSVFALPHWPFNSREVLSTWRPNSECADVAVSGDVLKFHTVGSDPFLQCDSVSFETAPWQGVRIQIKADKTGLGDLFWTGNTTGAYGGLSEGKKSTFRIEGQGEWETITFFPGWHTEGKIVKLRLDLYDNTQYEIRDIEIFDWSGGKTPLTTFPAMKDMKDFATWISFPGCEDRFMPPLKLTNLDQGWVTFRLTSQRDGVGSVLWMSEGSQGLQSEQFSIKGDGLFHTYNLALDGYPSWHAPLVAFGLRLPKEILDQVTIEDLKLSADPTGPPELEIVYLGFENGVNRVGRFCNLLVQVRNVGGKGTAPMTAWIESSSTVHVIAEDPIHLMPGLDYGEQRSSVWTLRADEAGDATAAVVVKSGTQTISREVTLHFESKVDNGYPPPPKPIKSAVDVCMYYFPGWENDAKWDCVRRVAPVRKPLLGYYDESNPECVDWQIKWARENGISCFLVDWYWCKGDQILTHWFEAYRKARYRDQLQVAIMWANHNPPGNHSMEDWRDVTREWINRYFNLPGYYKIDGKPAVFIWSPTLIREDMGSSQGVRGLFEESFKMAREAGYEGISFVAMFNHDSPTQAQTLLDEGYSGCTNYHEWGTASETALTMNEMRYSDVAKTAPRSWAKQEEMCGQLTYYPVVDSGWDSRPWHGAKSLVISGRTPELFEDLLTQAKAFATEKKKPFIVLGPANEWGEGSYLEPCTEYGFGMYEKIRKVFGEGDPQTWPVNLGPADLGLGPYDYIPARIVHEWTFDEGREGWGAMMNLKDFRCEDGALRMRTISTDPAMMVSSPGLKAADYSRAVLKMQLTGKSQKETSTQIFWSAEGSQASWEASSVHIPTHVNGQMHEYQVDFSQNPHWRGKISQIRFDPCNESDVEVVIEEFRFIK